MKNALVLALSALVLFLGGTAWLSLYPAIPRDLAGAKNLDAAARRVRIPVGDGDHLDAWLLPGTQRAVIVLFAGYARDHYRTWRYAQFLKPDGYTLLAVEFRSGRATNRKPTTLGAYEREDAEAVLAWLARRPEYRKARIGLFGESLGGATALAAAADHPEVTAVVVDCPFASGELAVRDAFACQLGMPAWPFAPLAVTFGRLATQRDFAGLDARAALRALGTRPVLLIQTARGDRFSVEQVRALEGAAGPGVEGWTVTDSRHNAVWLDHRREYEARVRAFFAAHLLRARLWLVEPAPAAAKAAS